MAAMIPRGNITGADFDDTTLTVTYQVNNSDVANAWLWLYDTNDTYIGWTNSAVSWDAGQTVDNNIIPGTFNIDGTDTTMVIEVTDFNDQSATLDFADVAKVILLLTDGSQYTGDFAFDYRSISPLTDAL